MNRKSPVPEFGQVGQPRCERIHDKGQAAERRRPAGPIRIAGSSGSASWRCAKRPVLANARIEGAAERVLGRWQPVGRSAPVLFLPFVSSHFLAMRSMLPDAGVAPRFVAGRQSGQAGLSRQGLPSMRNVSTSARRSAGSHRRPDSPKGGERVSGRAIGMQEQVPAHRRSP